jgi:DUF1680 family protein
MTTRRTFLLGAATASAALCFKTETLAEATLDTSPLKTFDYSAVTLAPGLAQTQFEKTQTVLLNMNEDSMLKPMRTRTGLPAPGPSIGGWYDEIPNDKTPSGGGGFAPGEAFGQWLSALSRGYAITRDARTKEKVERVLAAYEPTLLPSFFKNFRFPAYNYDKSVQALVDAHQYLGAQNAFALLDKMTDAAEPWLPPQALDRGDPQRKWRASIGEPTTDDMFMDEPYTIAENLYLAADSGAGERYRRMARKYLLNETWFDPLAANKNVLDDHHAYSFCNSLSSAMQAWLSDGSREHLDAARNAFRMITEQSFATGGWGPDESFIAPGSGKLFKSLSETHRGFETPCGSYAHFKLTRKLLQVTRDGRYGDSMEHVLYNTVLGAKPLMPDGRSFYYSDYNFNASKVYFPDAWPCCSGTLPLVAADYRILCYFHTDHELFVNLYLPSTVRWTHADGSAITLTQTSNYPIEGRIEFALQTSRPISFPIKFRIPAWAAKAQSLKTGEHLKLSVNGNQVPMQIRDEFVTIDRRWQDGDKIVLNLPMLHSHEPIDPEHPDTVALMRGPLVLFALTEKGAPTIHHKMSLDFKQLPGRDAWQVASANGPLTLLPFIGIEDQKYSAYVNLAWTIDVER